MKNSISYKVTARADELEVKDWSMILKTGPETLKNVIKATRIPLN